MAAISTVELNLSVDDIVLLSIEDIGHHIEALEPMIEAQHTRIELLEQHVVNLEAKLGIIADLDVELLVRVAHELERKGG